MSLYKTSLSKANVKTIEWGVQNEPISKNVLLVLTASFFWKFN